MKSLVSARNIVGAFILVISSLLASLSFAASNATPWPQDRSDLKPDPALKFGTLSNGMRYIVMHNNTPTDTVSLRFRFATGSIQENDAQQGIAHLLEHMAFRGSTHVVDGELDKILERIGLKFGADTNAFTSTTQTAYKFDLPNATDENVDTGLMLMREIASELNITDEALKTERGVVLSEMRLRDTPEMRAGLNEIAALMPGMRAPTRWPIGKADILEKVDAKTVRSYYQAYYHPERATLIVVGNVDADKMAKKIVAKFSDWKPAKKSDADPHFGKLKPVDHAAHIFIEPSLSTSISLSFAGPYDPSADSLEKQREDFIRYAGLSILNLRFQQAALADNAAFTEANASHFDNLFKSISGSQISVSTTPEKWREGLLAAQRIVNSALNQGVRQDEVDRVISTLRTSLQTDVAGANTRHTPELANSLVSTLESNEVFLSPQQNLDIAETAFKNLKAEQVTEALRKAFSGTNTMAFLTSSKAIDGGEAKLATAYKQAVNDVSKDDAAQAAMTWPYTRFGEKGTVATQTKQDDIDTTFVKFENGVMLAIKHTTFSAGQVDVVVKMGDGRLSVKKDGSTPNFMLNALVAGGLEKIDFPTLQQVLAGKTYRVEPALNENNIALHGVTTPADLDVQLQVLTAYVTESALRKSAFEQLRNMWIDNIPTIDAQPLYSLLSKAPFLLHSNDMRWRWPSVQDVKDTQRDALKAWVEPQLKHGPIQIAIVGDVDVQRAIDSVATTLGSLPTRPAAVVKASPAGDAKFPSAMQTPLVLTHTGNKNQAQALIAWPVADSRSNLAETADLHVLSNIVQARMIDAMRSKTGSSYTANAKFDGSWQFSGYGYLAISSDTKPEQTKVFFDAVNEVVEDLRKDAVSTDEFSRAQLPMLAGISKQQQSNEFWARSLVSTDIDAQYADWLRKQPDYIKAVNPERIHTVAKKYLVKDKEWKAVMMPQAEANEEKK